VTADQLAGLGILVGLAVAYVGARRAWAEWLGDSR